MQFCAQKLKYRFTRAADLGEEIQTATYFTNFFPKEKKVIEKKEEVAMHTKPHFMGAGLGGKPKVAETKKEDKDSVRIKVIFFCQKVSVL